MRKSNRFYLLLMSILLTSVTPILANAQKTCAEIFGENQATLTEDEFYAIRRYQAHGYNKTNDYLRKGQDAAFLNRQVPDDVLKWDLEKVQEALPLLRSGMNKLPRHQGVLYRGVSIPKADVMHVTGDIFSGSSLKIGAIVVDKAFLSASKSFQIAQEWFAGDPADNASIHAVFEIASKNARVIPKEITSGSHEQELIFMPNTRFRVVSVKQNENGFYIIQIVEI